MAGTIGNTGTENRIMQASTCGRYIIGEYISVIRERIEEGVIKTKELSGTIVNIRTVNNRTLVIIAYGNRHASFYDDEVYEA